MKRRMVWALVIALALAIALGGCAVNNVQPESAPAAREAASGQSGPGMGPDERTQAPAETGEPEPRAERTRAPEDEDVFFGVSDAEELFNEADYEKYTEQGGSLTPDEYRTEAQPDDMPGPVEWQDLTVDKNAAKTCTLYVECGAILNNLEAFDPDKMEVLPPDGVVYPSQTATFYEGETVFDLLWREMQNNRIHMEFVMAPLYNSNYIKGIGNIYEYDCGNLSGWMFSVNGWFPNYGSGRYLLREGDVVEWHYTCDLGRDFGVTWERPEY